MAIIIKRPGRHLFRFSFSLMDQKGAPPFITRQRQPRGQHARRHSAWVMTRRDIFLLSPGAVGFKRREAFDITPRRSAFPRWNFGAQPGIFLATAIATEARYRCKELPRASRRSATVVATSIIYLMPSRTRAKRQKMRRYYFISPISQKP